VRLAELGRRIEAHFGRPQDIEWCLVDDDLHIVQSRPITTLFPIPEVGDQENHVYGSVGHQQMMTDPITPLGLSLWQLTTPRPMSGAGGRLFVDVTQALAHPTSCTALLEMMGRSDPLMRDALQRILDRGDFIAPRPAAGPMPAASGPAPAPMEADPAVVTELIARSELSVAALQHAIRERSGPELLACILADLQELKRILLDPRSQQVLMSAMDASRGLDERLEAWLGERNAADTLAQSVPHNVTSEMGLALLDVADVIRLHPEVVALLHAVEDERFLDELSGVAGGRRHTPRCAWLDRHGMRGVGEIDVANRAGASVPACSCP
jgi:pyruvate,water dikinase